MVGIVSLVLWSAVVGEPALPWPPEPTFDTPVDYEQWLDTIFPPIPAGELNAATIYREIIDSDGDGDLATSFPLADHSGFEIDAESYWDFPRPWHPEEFPRWELSYQRERRLLERIEDAARLPYCDFRALGSSRSGVRVILLRTDRAAIGRGARLYCRALFEAAWRSESGRLEVAGLCRYIRAALGVARHLEQDPFMYSFLYATIIRESAYHELGRAIDRAALTAEDIEQALSALDEVDSEPVGLDRYLRAECAMVLEAVQFAAIEPDRCDWENLTTVRDAFRRKDFAPQESARTVLSWFDSLDYLTRFRFRRHTDRQLQETLAHDQYVGAMENYDVCLRNLTANYTRPHDWHSRMLASRHAVRAICRMSAFKARTGQWPSSLNQLRLGRFARDPFGQTELKYRVTATGPLLYSIGLNRKDDGGTTKATDPRRPNETDDYVFWPIATSAIDAPAPLDPTSKPVDQK